MKLKQYAKAVMCCTSVSTCPLHNTASELLRVLKSFPGFLANPIDGDKWIEKKRAVIAKAKGVK